jgi:hypothetical protein
VLTIEGTGSRAEYDVTATKALEKPLFLAHQSIPMMISQDEPLTGTS